MDIWALSMEISQSRIQESFRIEVKKVAVDTGKETVNIVTERIRNCKVDSNLGQHLDGMAL